MIITIFSNKKRSVGDELDILSFDRKKIKGRIIGKCEDEEKYWNQSIIDMDSPDYVKYVNSGMDYYRVSIDEEGE